MNLQKSLNADLVFTFNREFSFLTAENRYTA